MADHQQYVAQEIFICLPSDLRTLEFYTWKKSPPLQDRYSIPLSSHDMPQILTNVSPSIPESLTVYGLLTTTYTLDLFLLPVISSYIFTLTKPPPPPSQTKPLASGCEICDRDWIPLTYHHLIPRALHAKVLKRGWHREDQLENVAWLCRACHSFVHRVATNEELAREAYTVDLLLEREDVLKFAAWVGKVRWKTK